MRVAGAHGPAPRHTPQRGRLQRILVLSYIFQTCGTDASAERALRELAARRDRVGAAAREVAATVHAPRGAAARTGGHTEAARAG